MMMPGTHSAASRGARKAAAAAWTWVALILVWLPSGLRGQDVVTRIVDVGPGLCAVTSVPGDHYFVYDAGHWLGGNCLAAVRDIVREGHIDLLILSHSDSDHLGDAERILREFEVAHVVWTGDRRPASGTWERFNEALGAEVVSSGATVRTLMTDPLRPGETIPLGEATVTLIAGWGEWTAPGPTPAERRNAISVVARLDYRGHAILFAGDAVGRRRGDEATACRDSEALMAANDSLGVASLRADVLVAPHHGGDNASATCFIQRVSPEVVVFSAGHEFSHPTEAAARRYLELGVAPGSMFRTDLGDDEGAEEWAVGRIAGCRDPRGDDDVIVVLPGLGPVRASYRTPHAGCEAGR